MVIMFLITFGCGTSKSLDNQLIGEISTGQIRPEQLIVKDGMVSYNYTILLPAGSIGRTQTLKMNPIVKFGNQSLQLPASYVQGQAVKHTDFPVVKCHESFEIRESYKFTWQPGMEKAEIVLQTEISRCGKLRTTGEAMLYSKGIQLLSEKPVKVEDTPAHPAIMTGEIRGIVMFPMASDRIVSGQDYMKYLRINLDTVMAYPGAVLTSVTIQVSCSPDGNTVFNTQLGAERYRVAHEYFEQELGFTHYMGNAAKDIYSYQVITQNWKDLYNMLEDSDITGRDEIIQTMEGAELQKREQLLVRYMNRYPAIKEQYLPSLRNAQIVIKYKMPWHEVKPTIYPSIFERK